MNNMKPRNKMKKRLIGLLLAWLSAAGTMQAAPAKHGFAIVVDPKSHAEAKTEINEYAHAIETLQGLKVHIVIDKWGVPDSIRKELYRLYRQKDGIIGAVLMGDIPVAMIRDAQHLTSAFKMDQQHDRKESSVPSDRYYDDFDLRFEYIGKDDDSPYFYYSLSASSAQVVRPELFTGRIRPTAKGALRYEQLRRYLRKATAEKQRHNRFDQMMYFSGHGYISASMEARMDEKLGWYEHFPWLKTQKDGISYIDHSQQDNVKFLLMNELQRPELDFAMLHHHGAPDTQYLNGAPQIASSEEAKAMIREYCRNYLRTRVQKGQDKDSVTQVLCKRFDIPATWLSDAFEPAIVRKDSLSAVNKDLVLADFSTYSYAPDCRVVVLDACFNGSFHLDDCIADEYIFGQGHTIACIANTVNVLQDKWADRYVGLLGLGMYVGNVARFSGYLESHCIGDPTFAFTPAVKMEEVNDLLASNDPVKWQKYIGENTPSDLRSMAMEKLWQQGRLSSAQLLRIFRTSKSALVRLQALVLLAEARDDNFIEAMKLGVDDSYELVQRFAINYIGKSGDERLVPALIGKSISNNTSERCNFSLMNAMTMFRKEPLLAEFARQFDRPEVRYVQKSQVRKDIEKAINSNAGKWTEYMENIIGSDTPIKRRLMSIRTSRNYCPPYYVPQLLEYLEKCDNPDIQVALFETLGWRRYSYMAPRIAAFAKACSEDSRYAEPVRKEALKTYNRLK